MLRSSSEDLHRLDSAHFALPTVITVLVVCGIKAGHDSANLVSQCGHWYLPAYLVITCEWCSPTTFLYASSPSYALKSLITIRMPLEGIFWKVLLRMTGARPSQHFVSPLTDHGIFSHSLITLKWAISRLIIFLCSFPVVQIVCIVWSVTSLGSSFFWHVVKPA